ncbi:MAG: HAD-IIB family hydrolase [Ruminococcaceae bacterium]|nr:HAD-IIB family hydrolase [Oscillospiraceae bacterium]
MGKFDGILLMSDFDGTLSVRNGAISRENRDAIEYFESEGGRFCIASGRWGEYVKALRAPINAYCAVLNGTVIYDVEKNENVLELPLDIKKTVEFAKVISEACPKRECLRFHSSVERYNLYPDDDIEAVIDSFPKPLYKFLCIVPDEVSDEYLAKIRVLAGEDFYISRSWVNGIEIQPAGTTKGDAIARLKELYGGKIHTVVAVGDYENDVDMIKKADIGYAVANAVPELAAVADRHTVDCRDHAIAAIIKELA